MWRSELEVALHAARIQFEFSHVGWDALVAVGTLVLAAVTGTLAFFTYRLASKTSDLAASTSDEVKASLRPVLIPPAQGGQFPAIEAGTENLRLGVLNAGRGPALNAYAYAIVATLTIYERTDIAQFGNLAPNGDGVLVIPGVPDGDFAAHSDESYFAVFVVIVYNDLAGRIYHTVVGLSDPAKGGPVIAPQGTVGPPPARIFDMAGSEVGEGPAPPPQWRVTFSGPEISDDQKERMRASAIVLFGGHAVGTSPGPVLPTPASWRWSAFVTGAGPDVAINRLRDALADERFLAWHATLWVAGRLSDVEPS